MIAQRKLETEGVCVVRASIRVCTGMFFQHCLDHSKDFHGRQGQLHTATKTDKTVKPL